MSQLSAALVVRDGRVYADVYVNGLRIGRPASLVRLSEDGKRIHLSLPTELFREIP